MLECGSSQVRICMCQQLPQLAIALGNEMTRKMLLPEVLELLKDEEHCVQHAALESLLEICDILPAHALKETVMPAIKKYMQPLDLEMDMQRCVAMLFGPILVKVMGSA